MRKLDPAEKRRRANERARLWRLSHPEKVRDQNRHYAKVSKARAKQRYATDPEYRAKLCAASRAARLRRTEEQKQHYRGMATLRARRYRLTEAGKEQCVALTFGRKIRALLAVSDNLACAYCSETDIRVLSLNHKDGNGHSDPHRESIYNAILKGARSTSDLEITCFNCNIRYEYQLGRRKLPVDYEAIVASWQRKSEAA